MSCGARTTGTGAGEIVMEICVPTSITFEIYLDPDRCIQCGVCVDMCSMGVFTRNHEGIYPEKSHLCCSCFKCNEFCPEHAISTRWIMRA